MICSNCGTENEKEAVFCENCGQKMESVELQKVNDTDSVNNVSGKQSQKKWLIGIAVIIVVLVVLCFPKVDTSTINLNRYVTFNTSGYDGYGKIEVYIDWEAIEKQSGDKISYTSKAIKEYGELLKHISPIEVLKRGITVEISKDDNLSNGDEVLYTWKADTGISEYINCKLKCEDGTYIVSNLETPPTFDPFASLEVTFEGASPSGKLKYKYDGEIFDSYDFSCDKYSHLSNGETVTITIDDINVESMLKRYGKIPKTFEKQYVVTGLQEYVSSYSKLSKDFIAKLKKEAEDTIYSYIAKNYDSTSSLTDLKYAGYVYGYIKDSEGEISNYNDLYIIYSGKVSNSVGKFDTTVAYFPVQFTNIAMGKTEISYQSNNGIIGNVKFPNSTYTTKGYLNPLTCHSALVKEKETSYIVEAGDGFEKYTGDGLIYKLSDIDKEYKDVLYKDARDRIEQYISTLNGNYYLAADLKYRGEYLLTLKTQGTDFKNNNKYIIVFSVMISSPKGRFEPTERFFPIEYDGIVEVLEDEYMYSSFEGILGKSLFDFTSVKGYASGTEMFSKVVTIYRDKYNYEVSDDIKDLGE